MFTNGWGCIVIVWAIIKNAFRALHSWCIMRPARQTVWWSGEYCEYLVLIMWSSTSRVHLVSYSNRHHCFPFLGTSLVLSSVIPFCTCMWQSLEHTSNWNMSDFLELVRGVVCGVCDDTGWWYSRGVKEPISCVIPIFYVKGCAANLNHGESGRQLIDLGVCVCACVRER